MTDDDPAPKPRTRIDWRNRDHTRGSLAISLLVLALPSLATSLAGVAFQITELTFISRLGEAPMASVVIVNQTLRQTFFMLLMGASFGTQALIAGCCEPPKGQTCSAKIARTASMPRARTLFGGQAKVGIRDDQRGPRRRFHTCCQPERVPTRREVADCERIQEVLSRPRW